MQQEIPLLVMTYEYGFHQDRGTHKLLVALRHWIEMTWSSHRRIAQR